jgi:hypothetical protein
MKADRNRHGRKDHSRARAPHSRATRRLRRLSLAACLLSLALAPLAAEAQTGGAAAPGTEDAATGGGLLFSSPMRTAGATWYGPGLYGNGTACGQTLRPGTIGVAHRSLPCGTTVKFSYQGRSLVTQVIDRGPYAPGKDFDLTNAARLALDFEGEGQVRYALAVDSAVHHD